MRIKIVQVNDIQRIDQLDSRMSAQDLMRRLLDCWARVHRINYCYIFKFISDSFDSTENMTVRFALRLSAVRRH
ncbi:hypothetical protein D3C80_1304920 [compost metagenome]